MPVIQALLDLLACPIDKGPLVYDAEADALYNPRLRRRYPVVNGIPYLLADQAETLDTPGHDLIMERTARVRSQTAPEDVSDVPAT
ncbi:Trm112 family protein [Streptomyces sp. H10-C2]|uniref:Trm112 family protein n=1 Tax=unclassified Streptomyces TaxID=2593676 RepID=UPI0024BAFC8A|nr:MULTISPECIES: Trm112 family protein [unclassified Streptomyces]MDJ0347196.1 Trm112 family protein [Streptomyces sp. PH10-H1]MDJ0370331.1 Trm112 family protein [Streptomyces sp. H10-C2]